MDNFDDPSKFMVPGFRVAAVAAGIRYRDRLDLALIASNEEAAAAGVFTTNRVQAAPVLVCREHLRAGRARAIVVNSGIANACTGSDGEHRARSMASLAAAALGCQTEQVLVASTGVIGMPVPLEPVAAAMPALVNHLRPDGWQDAARAIMTTDTVPKIHRVRGQLDGRQFTAVGIAKGAGMICPQMATLLVFVATDIAITPAALQQLVSEEVENTFNRITVDGDTSTNDTLLALANGKAGNPEINRLNSKVDTQLRPAFRDLLLTLARNIVADGEGATKSITIRVQGARSRAAAHAGAATVANSPLVKTAFFGEDANWGRIMAALGRAGIDIDANRVDIFFDDVHLVENGHLRSPEAEEMAAAVLRQPEFAITIDLHLGAGADTVYTCDLSIDYVKINADYRS